MPKILPGHWLGKWCRTGCQALRRVGLIIRLDEMDPRYAWAPGSTIGAVVHWDVI